LVLLSLYRQILRERAHDVNAFTRSKVLQVWTFLCDKDAIPKKAQPAVVQLATARLEDKSAQVRRCKPSIPFVARFGSARICCESTL
jgi:hypothetical protein